MKFYLFSQFYLISTITNQTPIKIHLVAIIMQIIIVNFIIISYIAFIIMDLELATYYKTKLDYSTYDAKELF